VEEPEPRAAAVVVERRTFLWDEPLDAILRTIAEAIGTFVLVFAVVGASVSASIAGEQGLLITALAGGLTYAVLISALGHISGGHFNPAVTVGLLVTRRIAPILGGMYIVAQLAASIGAAFMIRWLWPGTTAKSVGYGTPAIDPGLSTGEALVLEAVLTIVIVWVFFATAADPRGAYTAVAGFAIGLTYAVAILVAGPLTGGPTGSVANPARAFGPMVADWSWTDGWVWYAGPVLGGAIAALLYELLYLRPLRPPPVGLPEAGVEEPRPGEAALS
jgi:MIP family channel proteins